MVVHHRVDLPMRELFTNRSRSLIALLVGLSVAFGASGQERKAYKYVDEKGSVVYSQTPPTTAKEVKKVDIAPAHRGAVTTNEPNNSYGNRYGNQGSYTYTPPDSRAAQEYQRRREEAQKKRVDDLKAECNRNRGTDCNNPETLRQMESQRIPGGRYYAPQR